MWFGNDNTSQNYYVRADCVYYMYLESNNKLITMSNCILYAIITIYIYLQQRRYKSLHENLGGRQLGHNYLSTC